MDRHEMIWSCQAAIPGRWMKHRKDAADVNVDSAKGSAVASP